MVIKTHSHNVKKICFTINEFKIRSTSMCKFANFLALLVLGNCKRLLTCDYVFRRVSGIMDLCDYPCSIILNINSNTMGYEMSRMARAASCTTAIKVSSRLFIYNGGNFSPLLPASYPTCNRKDLVWLYFLWTKKITKIFRASAQNLTQIF